MPIIVYVALVIFIVSLVYGLYFVLPSEKETKSKKYDKATEKRMVAAAIPCALAVLAFSFIWTDVGASILFLVGFVLTSPVLLAWVVCGYIYDTKESNN